MKKSLRQLKKVLAVLTIAGTITALSACGTSNDSMSSESKMSSETSAAESTSAEGSAAEAKSLEEPEGSDETFI